jgi:hypothetical protein
VNNLSGARQLQDSIKIKAWMTKLVRKLRISSHKPNSHQTNSRKSTVDSVGFRGKHMIRGKYISVQNLKEIFMVDRNDFLYPRSRYYGKVKPENLVFNANLQEFAQRVNYICNLETAGKLPPEEAYDQIKHLWKELKQSKKELAIGQNPFQGEEGE